MMYPRDLQTQIPLGARKITVAQSSPFPQRNTPSHIFLEMHGPFSKIFLSINMEFYTSLLLEV